MTRRILLALAVLIVGGIATRLWYSEPFRFLSRAQKSAEAAELREIDGPPAVGLLDGGERTWEDVRNAFERGYLRTSPQWGFSETVSRALFYTAAVANLWPIGASHPGGRTSVRDGCRPSSHNVCPVIEYLKSPSAECNDYAIMLYMALKLAGIEARHVGTPDHIYIEAQLDGAPWILDPMNAFAVPIPSEEFRAQRSGPVRYVVFPLGTAEPRRESARYFYMLTRGRIDVRPPADYGRWDKFDVWLRLNGVEMDGDG